MSELHKGKVIQVTGPVLDIRFQEGELPDLRNAIEISTENGKLVAEVAQQIGISRSYVSRIEKRALEKLRAVLE